MRDGGVTQTRPLQAKRLALVGVDAVPLHVGGAEQCAERTQGALPYVPGGAVEPFFEACIEVELHLAAGVALVDDAEVGQVKHHPYHLLLMFAG